MSRLPGLRIQQMMARWAVRLPAGHECADCLDVGLHDLLFGAVSIQNGLSEHDVLPLLHSCTDLLTPKRGVALMSIASACMHGAMNRAISPQLLTAEAGPG